MGEFFDRADGDSIRFWVKAADAMSHTLVEDVLVHVDSTPPMLMNAGLLRNGEKQLAVHSNLDLFDLV